MTNPYRQQLYSHKKGGKSANDPENQLRTHAQPRKGKCVKRHPPLSQHFNFSVFGPSPPLSSDLRTRDRRVYNLPILFSGVKRYKNPRTPTPPLKCNKIQRDQPLFFGFLSLVLSFFPYLQKRQPHTTARAGRPGGGASSGT